MKTIINADISIAAELLKQDEVVAIPTETVYGLAANALHENAVKKIYEIKNRPAKNPLIIHLEKIELLKNYVKEIPDAVYMLAEKFSPGPVTFVLKKKPIIPAIVSGGKNSVAIRFPSHPVTQQLLKMLDFPLAAPSANPSGYISPTSADDVKKQLNGKINYILNGGNCEIGIESTIISFVNETPQLLRFGSISPSEIENIIGRINIPVLYNEKNPDAPGMLTVHYAPKKKLYFGNVEKIYSELKIKNVCIINFSTEKNISGANQFVLSKEKKLDEAAKNLYHYMHLADESSAEIIIAEPLPDKGIGLALNDRLRRASVKNKK